MNRTFVFGFLFCWMLFSVPGISQPVKLGLLKYNGGGDWYANPTSLPNLIKFCNKNLNTNINPEPATIEVGSRELFNVPMVHMTGHGNVVFSPTEVSNLRQYLESGGFLHIDDNYGLDVYIRREMKKVFPELDFILIPYDHPIYRQNYTFTNGLPKIHEHDNKPPQGFGLIYKKRLVCFYTYECDLGDGWEDPEVHNDSEAARTKALQMGANIVSYVFNQ
ncbi:MAG TPA: hypothetical protein DCQ26_00260 [Marinilabiliales bacterium]|nr:hypothetical protein [Marinilabiliales bacterium]HAZ03822.1 hypothetical protein [Marinilabiliales bacterium]HBO73558.1 hypothetical protein [Marinilabiliales bacterium]HBX86074.1 hypothetical protein [Marinilabiliales bacterium]HCC29819.1 hypothetical protein [Marinilabiliales bacterium]